MAELVHALGLPQEHYFHLLSLGVFIDERSQDLVDVVLPVRDIDHLSVLQLAYNLMQLADLFLGVYYLVSEIIFHLCLFLFTLGNDCFELIIGLIEAFKQLELDLLGLIQLFLECDDLLICFIKVVFHIKTHRF